MKYSTLVLLIVFLKTTNSATINSSTALEDGIKRRIVGGEETDIVYVPYQAVIVGVWNNQVGPFCGGSIINSEWILTAAHCVENQSKYTLKVRVGSTNSYELRQELSVYDVRPHPRYNSLPYDYDIALLRVSEIEFNMRVAPIKLPTMNQPLPPPGTDLIASGWGRTTEEGRMQQYLRSVILKMVDFNQCKQLYVNTITPRMLCAGDYGKNVHKGDSGGPLVWRDIQIGVSSFIHDLKTAPHLIKPGVFANLANSELRDYIKKFTGV